MLSRCQKRNTREQIGVPQGHFTGLERLYNELLPDQILQHQITEEFIVRGEGYPLLGSKCLVRLPLVEIVGWDQSL